MNVHYRVELGNEERAVLEELVYRGSPRVRKVKRALILLAAIMVSALLLCRPLSLGELHR